MIETTATVTFNGITKTVPVAFGTAVRNKEGQLWDYEWLWTEGDTAPVVQRWTECKTEYLDQMNEEEPDEEADELVLVWTMGGDTYNPDGWFEYDWTERD